ncbi:MAG TPA: hypothetical protein VN759_04915 [Pseudolysinimonas sp.]|nr:hypothetical protein [Pseudolysinimonas sp.]
MPDVPSHELIHGEQRELDALRRRAYGPDADIYDDPVAVARLTALEDLVRLERAPREHEATTTVPDPATRPVMSAQPGPATLSATLGVASGPPRSPRWHSGLVAGTAAVAVLLGAAAWTAGQAAPADGPPSAHAKTAAIANERRAAGYEVGYGLYLDGLRNEVLDLPGNEDVAGIMIRDQLRPYGILYGRTVGAGPTTDHRFCMIIADLPVSSVTCIPIENAYANPVSVLLPSWYSDTESDVFTGLGELISYTIMPGGGVVAVPADSARIP